MNMMPARNVFSSPYAALTLDDAIRHFPTLGATQAHASRSARYAQIETREVLESLYAEGFRIHAVTTARTRQSGKRGYEKHMVRLRHVDAVTKNGVAPEVGVINSHDGTSTYKAFGGLLRFICLNGLVVGEMVEAISIKHIGASVPSRVVDAANRVLHQVRDVLPAIEEMRAVELSDDAREEFATRAHGLRFNVEDKAPVSPLALLTPRRAEDTSKDLWTTYNVIQENVIRGGLRGYTTNDAGRVRRSTLRAVNGIDQSYAINRDLFNLAHEMHRSLALAA